MTLKENNFRRFIKKIYQNEQLLLAIFLAVFLIQIIFSHKINSVKPEIKLIENAPNKKIIKILALGDDEFLFRSIALILQNTGDVFAGFTPLKNYNYKNLYDWLMILDDLNQKSDVLPNLTVNYYSYTQKKSDLIYLIRYLDNHSMRNLEKKWWWLVQAFIIAKNYYQDNNLALDLALKLSKNKTSEMPIWIEQLPVFVYDDIGQDCMAFSIIKNLMDEHDKGTKKISAQEMDFMRHYIKKILLKLKKQNFKPEQCQNLKQI